MADALSIASGIAGLLSLGIQVTQSLVNFYTTYRGQRADLANITHNLNNLHGILQSLKAAVEDIQFQCVAQDLLEEVEKATGKCEEIIKELRIECQRFHDDSAASFKGRIQVAGRRAAYPFRKSTLQKLEEDISEIRENLSFALDVLQLKSHSHIQDNISEVKAVVERIDASQVSLTIRAWLLAPDASLNHNAISAKRHQNTGQWFVNGDLFRNWLDECNSLLWLNGFSGCGKSVLCSTTVQHLFRETRYKNDVGIAFFYFTFTDEAKQDDNGMLRALLLQFSVQLQDGERNLEQLHALYKAASPSVNILLEWLRTLLGRFSNSYILLDALDECPRGNRRKGVLDAIQAIRSWLIRGVHLLVTSRNCLDIRESLSPSRDQDIPMRSSGIDEDIENFVSYQLNNDAKLQKWKVRHKEIKTKLTTGAQGVFRYVECQLNAIRKAGNRNRVDECLHALPRDLEDTYERILISIGDEYAEDVRRVLTVLCFSTRPLTVNELIDAHAVELSQPPSLDRDGRGYEQDDLIDICLGLVDTTEVQDEFGGNKIHVHIAHFSVKEYLLSKRIQQGKMKKFAVQGGPANMEIAQICIVYLLDPILSRGKLDQAKLEAFPLARYAAQYWHHHFQSAQEKAALTEELLQRLFCIDVDCFATSVKLYDLDATFFPDEWYDMLMEADSCPRVDFGWRLYYASLLGLESVVRGMITRTHNDGVRQDVVNVQYGHCGTSLQAASFGGYEKVVEILLDRGADINIQGGFYGNPFQAASYSGNAQVVQILLRRGADIYMQGGYYGNALQAASHAGNIELVKMLLDRGTDVNLQGGHYKSALLAASQAGHEDVVQILLGQSAEINTAGGDYGNALQAAIIRGHEKVAQMLLDHGADVNIQGGWYGNALQAASFCGHEKIVQDLIDRGAVVSGRGALSTALLKGKTRVALILLANGADINNDGEALWYTLPLLSACYMVR